MCTMVFDVVKARAQVLLRHVEHTRELIFEIANLRRVAETVFDLSSGKRRDTRRCEKDLLVQVRRWITGDPDVVQILSTDAGLFQAISNRLFGKTGRVLVSIEALFLSRGNQPSIANERGGRVTVICIDS